MKVNLTLCGVTETAKRINNILPSMSQLRRCPLTSIWSAVWSHWNTWGHKQLHNSVLTVVNSIIILSCDVVEHSLTVQHSQSRTVTSVANCDRYIWLAHCDRYIWLAHCHRYIWLAHCDRYIWLAHCDRYIWLAHCDNLAAHCDRYMWLAHCDRYIWLAHCDRYIWLAHWVHLASTL